MRPLILVAASGLAVEALEAAWVGGLYEVVGVLDDDDQLHGSVWHGVTVLGGIGDVVDHPGAALVVCAGKGTTRRTLVERLRDLGADEDRYATIVHPSVFVPGSCVVGAGSILLAGTVLTATVTIGTHVVVMPNAVLTHDNDVGDFATICAGVVVGGYSRVGAAAYVGMGAKIRERTIVGPEATVGMGSVVISDVPEGETWVGVPARALQRDESDGGSAR